MARDQARDVLAVERALRLDVEAAVQELLVEVGWLTTLADWVYIWGHWPVIVATMVWLALHDRTVFLRLRNAMIARGDGPVRPHDLPGGAASTGRPRVRRHDHRAVTGVPRASAPSFVNQYAAMPSSHVG